MLEKKLQKGMTANWLPTHEAGTQGTGKEMSRGSVELPGGAGIYLPFAANGINCVASQGKDVISYNFTGCIMAAYTQNGSRRVCHVSTGKGQDCKTEWEAIRQASTHVIAFKPHEFANIDAIQQAGQAFNCYGLITAAGECFSIAVGGQMSDSPGQRKMIVVVSCDKVTQFL
ncbi:hypothetical protein DSCA_52140 [Desulfosarcina alkanivorans]|jgi:hypothetical protein|uniref:Uncharacterized protein n=1 Tax=Desulfosarcina alkanivorans TaxID=571177 RepID=A0A5K7YY92_9BACT|nr:hypothetical protein [Desulfosarcina alkanivorans]BBO71284.1 hypothetical protein DSCA_52140 [Desulfosarcina alkanivorans]